MRRLFSTLLAAFLPLLFVLSACDSGGGNEDFQNEFTMTIEPASSSGSAASLEASTKNLSGFSFFYDAENPDTGEQAFGIYLNHTESFSKDQATQGLFGYIARNSGRPSSGTYQFTSGEGGVQSSQFVGLLYEDFTRIQSAPFYVIQSGTLTLETSNSNKVAGSIEATGTSFTFTGSSYEQQEVTITGTFTAKDVETFVGFYSPGL